MALWRSIGTRKDATRGTVPIETRKGTSAYWATTGVVAGGPTVLGSGTAGFAYSVAGPVQFVTSRGASDGHHVYGNDGATTVPITNAAGVNTPGAPGSGLQRIDICWTRHQTAGENGDPATTVANASAPLFGVESGTAASANPQAPSLPSGAIELFRNTMTSAATSTASAGNTIAQTAAVANLRVPAPAALPYALFYVNTSETYPIGAWSNQHLDAVADTAGFQPWTLSTAARSVTLTESGLYDIRVVASMAISTFVVRVSVNTGVVTQSATGSSPSNTNECGALRRLAAGDVITVQLYPTSSANNIAHATNTPAYMSISKLSV